MRKKKKDLMDAFEMSVNKWQKIVPKDKTRDKELQYDPWEIYDMKHNQKFNIYRIAEMKANSRDKLTREKDINKAYKVVCRSYKRACKLIKQVEKEAQQ